MNSTITKLGETGINEEEEKQKRINAIFSSVGIGGQEDPSKYGTLFTAEPKPVRERRSIELTPEEEARGDGVLRQTADIPIKIGIGVNNVVKGISDMFGADNAVSQTLSNNVDWYKSLLSAQAIRDEKEVARILEEAQDKGMLEQLTAALQAFRVSPLDLTAEGIGSIVPFLATAKAGAVLGGARAAKLGLEGAKRAAYINKVVSATQAGTGAGVGMGIVKGEIYDAVVDELVSQGIDESIAKETASKAQAYNGKNLDQILLGAGLGAAAASVGAERVLGKWVSGQNIGKRTAKGVVQEILKGGIQEAIPEAFQGAQEKFAANLALRREGVDVPLSRGVYTQGFLEGLIGGVVGGGVSGIATTTSGRRTLESEDRKTIGNKITELEKQSYIDTPSETTEAVSEEDPVTTATERIKEKSAELDQKNIPNQSLKIVEQQAEEAKARQPVTQEQKTSDDILDEREAELSSTDTKAAELDEDSKTRLERVAKGQETQEDIKVLTDKGYVYQVEGKTVITESARLGLGTTAAPLSEKARLEGIRDRFQVTNEELNNSTDRELQNALKRGREILPNLKGKNAERAVKSLDAISAEISRRANVESKSKAGTRSIIDDRILSTFTNLSQKVGYIGNKITEGLSKGFSVELVNPQEKSVSEVVGINQENGNVTIRNKQTKEESTIPFSQLESGESRLEIFDPEKSRSRETDEEISEPLNQPIGKLPTPREGVSLEIDDVKSTPLKGYEPRTGNEQEAGRKAADLRRANASNPIEFLNNIVKEGGIKGKLSELLMKIGQLGDVKINIGRYGISPTQRNAGFYNPKTNEIFINLDERDGYSNSDGSHDVLSTLLHELVHAAFYNKLQNKETLNKAEAKAVRELESIYDKFVEKYSDSGLTGNTANALKNLQEFASEVLVNPEVQNLVNDLTPDKSLLQKVLQYILNFVSGKELNPYNELSQAFKAFNTLTEPTTEVEPTAEAEVASPAIIEQTLTEGVKEDYEGRTKRTTETRQELPTGYKGKAGGRPIPASDIARRARQFREGVSRVYEEHPQGKAVTVKDLEFYEDPNNTLFMSEDGLAGVAVTADADLVSVFKLPESTDSIGTYLKDAAQISKTLDAYDIGGFLPSLYSPYGFRAVAKMKFNREYAPKGWTYDTLGEPDIVFMAKTEAIGESIDYNTIKDSIPYVNDWDSGVELQKQAYDKGIYSQPETTLASPALTDTAEDIKARTVAGTPVGTRSPTAARATESGVDPNSVIDLKAARKDPRTYKRNALLLTQYSHIANEYPELSNRFKKISKPLTDIENVIEQDKTKLDTLKEKLKLALAKEKGIAKSKIKGKDIEDAIAQENKKTSRTLKPIISRIKSLEARIAKNKDKKKNISKLVNNKLDKYVMAADISMEKADSIYESIVRVIKSNLRTLFELFPADLVKVAKLWYDGANILAQEFAERFNTNLNRASAVLAVFSPQKDWFMNISLAERAMEVWNTKQDTKWDAEMSKQYLRRAGDPEEIIDEKTGEIKYEKGAQPIKNEDGEIVGWKNWKDEQAAAKRKKAVLELKKMEGKKLKDLPPLLQSRFIRMYAETKFPASYNIYSPNGTKLGLAKTDKGADKKVAWGGYNTIDKAIAILSASPENEMQVISDSLGEQHKVRSFYNNIVDPQNKSGAVTMDTHAIGAGLFMALSGASKEVTQNFGGGGTTKSSIIGANGLYAAFAEGYRQLAPELSKDFGIDYLPREIQSVTWEAIRMLFPAKWKSNKTNVSRVRDIWKQYEQGTKTIEQARSDIFELAKGKSIGTAIAEAKANGEGLGRPDWATDTEFGIDNLGNQRRADDTGRLPEGGRDTDGAGRPARGRGGVEPTTGVVSRPTEGGEPGAVLTEETLPSPALTEEGEVLASPVDFLREKAAGFFPSGLKTKYEEFLRSNFLFRWVAEGNRSPEVQKAFELMEAKIKKFLFGASNIQDKLERAAKKDNIKYEDVKKVADKAFLSATDNLTLEQIEEANREGGFAELDAIEKWIKDNLTEEQIKSFAEAEKAIQGNQWLEENLTAQQKTKLEAIRKTAAQTARTKKEKELLNANYNRQLKDAEAALRSLPENLRNAILDARAEMAELVGDDARKGVLSPNATVTIGGKEVKVEIEKKYWIQDSEEFANQLKQDKDVMNNLITTFQEMYISNKANEITSQPLEKGEEPITMREAREIAASQFTKTQAENLVKSFINAAVKSPNKAFKEILIPGLALTPQQQTAGLTREMKELFKGYGDARSTYAQIVNNLAEKIAYTQGWAKIRDLGVSQGWILPPGYKGEIPMGYVDGGDSRVTGFSTILKGFKVDPVFMKEVNNTFSQVEKMGGVLRILMGMNGLSMAAQTSLSFPRGHIRNFAGNLFFFIAGGKYEIWEFAKSGPAAWAAFTRKGKDGQIKYVKRLMELDVLDQTVQMAIIKDQIDAAKGDEALARLLKDNSWFRRGMDFAGRAYNLGDNVWKIAAYELELKTVSKAYANGIPAKVAGTNADIAPDSSLYKSKLEELAADRVKNYMISMSRMNALGRTFRKPGIQALFASFIGFTSEVIRISHANVAMALEDIKSGNATLKVDGFRRLAGTLVAHTAVVALAATLKGLMGIGDDEEDAARRTMPEWDKRASLIFWRNEDGSLSYFNTSFINAYSAISADPIRAFIKSWEENDEGGMSAFINSSSEALSQAFGGYIEPQIFVKAVNEAYSNKIGDRQVYNPEASTGKKMMDITMHLGNALVPGSTRQARGLLNAVMGEPDSQGRVPQVLPALVNFSFARSSNINADNSFRNRMFEVNRRKRDASRLITSLAKTRGNVSDDKITAAYNRANQAYNNVLSDAHTYYNDGLVLGLTRRELEKNMRDAGLSKDDISQIRRGYIKPYEVSPTTLREIPIARAAAIRAAIRNARSNLARPTGAIRDPKGLIQT